MRELLRLRFQDLVSDVRARAPLPVIGRDTELRRLARALNRLSVHHMLLSGKPGCGKTMLVRALVHAAVRGVGVRAPSLPYIQLDTEQCAELLRGDHPAATAERIRVALQSLPAAVVWIDDADALLTATERSPWVLERMLRPFFDRTDLRLVLCATETGARVFVDRHHPLLQHFDELPLRELPPSTCMSILARLAPHFQVAYQVAVADDVPATAVTLSRELATERALPDRAIRLLDESCAACAATGKRIVTDADVREIVAERTGAPVVSVQRMDRAHVSGLPRALRERVVGQAHATDAVADIVQRGWLGLRSPTRPIGAFLFLGPSGVGKTECAKVLADVVYGTPQALLRLDMSEFREPHMRQRLIGAPPGYIGHDDGGQLTNPVRERPYSLILLDELEKAHPSTCDLFLQVLDDGRLTDGRGVTVDFTKTVVIATSNLCTTEILQAAVAGTDVSTSAFLKRTIRPHLLRAFRPEFLNRFDAVVVFRPLTENMLMEIAKLELRKIGERASRHHVQFRVSDDGLRAVVRRTSDPAFGARPLKRFLEATCERMVAEQVLARTAP